MVNFISRINLSYFRNYQELSLDLSKGCVVIYGANGQGKTNLLEAISLLSPGRGLRRASYKELCNNEQLKPFIINAILHNSDYGEVKIGTTVSENLTSRKLRINQLNMPLEKLNEYCRILWITPLQDRLFIGGARDRCRFLDRLVFAIDSQHAKRLRNYEKLLLSRNCLLQESQLNKTMLNIYEEEICRYSFEIAVARRKLVSLLQAIIEEMIEEDFFIKAKIGIKGEIEVICEASDAAEQLRIALYNNRKIDSLSQSCQLSALRSDLIVEHKAKAINARYCSTGEQKGLLLNLILGQSILVGKLSGTLPILLCDEIGAHFDEDKRNNMFDSFYNYGSQIIMTGTEYNIFSFLANRAQFINLG